MALEDSVALADLSWQGAVILSFVPSPKLMPGHGPARPHCRPYLGSRLQTHSLTDAQTTWGYELCLNILRTVTVHKRRGAKIPSYVRGYLRHCSVPTVYFAQCLLDAT